jgi:hypothetical protein
MEHGDQEPKLGGVDAAASGWDVSDAVRELREGVRSSIPLPAWGDAASSEWRTLRGIAERHGFIKQYGEHEWSLKPLGGSEHDCLLCGEYWEKVTKSNCAGWFFDFELKRLLPATPLQYLRRLELANQIFEPRVELIGLEYGSDLSNLRIRTRQRHVEGEIPTPTDIAQWLNRFEFSRRNDLKIGA